jgi:hypothetical protein
MIYQKFRFLAVLKVPYDIITYKKISHSSINVYGFVLISYQHNSFY